MSRNQAKGKDLKVEYVGLHSMDTASAQISRKPVRRRFKRSKSQKAKAHWISSHINKKVCKTFIVKKPAADSSKSVCACGYRLEEHSSDVSTPQDRDVKSWNDEKDTELQKSDAFGEVKFIGYNQASLGKYVRVASGTDVDPVMNLMTRQWALSLPNLVISVTGGAKDFNLKPKLKELFNRGLMKSATSTGAWIITGGMHAGVMKLVGEAVRDYTVAYGTQNRITAIGVLPWGCVHHRGQLVNKKSMGKWPAYYKVKEAKGVPEASVDPNHTHFIMIDNGTQHRFGTEIKFRSKLEKAMSEKKTGTGNVCIPIVCVCLEGGPGTLETVKSAIEEGTPAVIVEGSGRAADILAYAYSQSEELEIEAQDPYGHTKKEIIPIVDDKVWQEVKEKICKEFGNKDVDKHVNYVKKCIQRRGYMTVYRVDGKDSAKDIDIAILQALLKVNKGSLLDQLRLALAWKRVDIAKSHIFTSEQRIEPQELHEVMFTALESDRVHFVKLFLENGLNLKDFLTKRRLLELYAQAPASSILRQMLQRNKFFQKKAEDRQLKDIYSIIQNLTGGTYRPNEMEDKESDDDEVTEQLEPERELFLWAIMLARSEMAKLFWDQGKDGIAAMLIGQKITQELSNKTPDTELQKTLVEEAEQYGNLAVGVLNQCYSLDESKAGLLLVRELSSYSGTTVLLLAAAADNKTFTAHAACQTHLTTIWLGRLHHDTGYLAIAGSLLFPLLIPLFIKFSSEEDEIYIAEEEDSSVSEKEDSSQKDEQVPEQPQTKELGYFTKIYYFYTCPKITFVHNWIFYTAFLLLYSGILLTTDLDRPPQPIEYVLAGWVFTIMMEEVRQLVTNEAAGVKQKIRSYLFDFWNILDIITIVLFFIGVGLRIAEENCHDCLRAARVVLSVNLMTFYFRILHIFSVHKELGPKLVMIGRMMIDLIFFIIILFVFIVAFGVASQAILYPNSDLDITLIRDILRKPYWQIYGELFLEEIEGEQDCTDNPALYNNGTLPRCVDNNWVVPILLGMYILITNVLMLNLLIAMFSYTFEHVQVNTDAVWKTQRYQLVREYHNRPWLAPPLILLAHVYMVVKGCFRCCSVCAGTESTAFKRKFEQSEEDSLMYWENMNTDEFIRRNTKHEQRKMENQVLETTERVQQISSRVDELTDEMHSPSGGSKIPHMLDDRITYLEQQMSRTAKQMDFIVQCIGGSKSPPKLPHVDSPEDAKRKRDELMKVEQQKLEEKLKARLELHQKARTEKYQGGVRRIPVLDEDVSWKKDWPEYDPKYHTDGSVLQAAGADFDLLSESSTDEVSSRAFKFNSYDDTTQVNRKSFCGTYEISEKGLPINPKGRTGLAGRGLLWRWGPNHACDLIVTRWKRNNKGDKVEDEKQKKFQLEYITVKREDCNEWAIMGEFIEAGESMRDCLKRCFSSEALGLQEAIDTAIVNEIVDKRVKIYEGYVDDPRNTDNAWVETTAVTYHAEGEMIRDLELKAGEGATLIDWQVMSSKIMLYADHRSILKLVANKHNAAF